VIDATTNIIAPAWTPIATNTLSSTNWLFVDTNTPVLPGRFFRIRLLP
jgi:hypothetical protein